MTPEQVKQMKQERGVWLNHERSKPRAISSLSLGDLMWAFEVGWCMSRGIPIREVPAWLDQPAVLHAHVKGVPV